MLTSLRLLTVTFPSFITRDLAFRARVLMQVSVDLAASELLGHTSAAFDAMDQPSVDAINTFVVSRAARDAGLSRALRARLRRADEWIWPLRARPLDGGRPALPVYGYVGGIHFCSAAVGTPK